MNEKLKEKVKKFSGEGVRLSESKRHVFIEAPLAGWLLKAIELFEDEGYVLEKGPNAMVYFHPGEKVTMSVYYATMSKGKEQFEG